MDRDKDIIKEIEDLTKAADEKISEGERLFKVANDKREEIIQKKGKLREVEDELAGSIFDAKHKADELEKSGKEQIELGKKYQGSYLHAKSLCDMSKAFVPQQKEN